jgi:hypothetical protein
MLPRTINWLRIVCLWPRLTQELSAALEFPNVHYFIGPQGK